MTLAVEKPVRRPNSERQLSAREAEQLLGISASTVRTWYQRRARTGLYPASEDRRGNPQFNEFDLIRLRDGRRRLSNPPSTGYGEMGRYLTARDAETHLGIPASTVSTWHQRRDHTGLHSVGSDNRGHPLFYEVDLIVLRRGLRLRDNEGQRIYTMVDVGE